MLWVQRARQEHDAFADVLRERGVEVLYLDELLTDVLLIEETREEILEHTLRAANLRPVPAAEVREWLDGLAAAELTELLIGGIAWDELPFRPDALAARVASPGDFALPPLPNHYFTRDTSAWIYDGVSINTMAKQARSREAVHLDAIYRHHPLFAGRGHEVWSDGLPLPAHTEGGDILVVGNGCVLIGMGERTRPITVELLAERLFQAGAARQVIAARIPPQRSSMHLDTVLTMVDRDAFTIYPEVRDTLDAYSLRPGSEAARDRTGGRPLRRPRPGTRGARAAPVRDRRRPLRSGARAVGRRQQRARARTRRRRRLRAERRDEHPPAPRGHRGDHDRRSRARSRPRRPPVHVLPHRAGRAPNLETETTMATAQTTKARSLLKISDLDGDELERLLDLAEALKAEPMRHSDALQTQTVAMFFEKPSTRTRSSFAAAAYRLGALPLSLRPDELQLGRGEPIADTARVLSSYMAAIVIRTFAQAELEEVARNSDVPVINALSDAHHPCQALADLLTLRERFGGLAGLKIAYVGDGNNVANSLIEAGALAGIEVAVACPPGYEPAVAGGAVTHDPAEAVRGARAVYTDVWVSMGEDDERQRRLADLRPYQVNAELMAAAAPDAIFLHCLPAHRGEEVTAEVIDGPRSAVWQQAGNRLPTEQALLYTLVTGDWASA